MHRRRAICLRLWSEEILISICREQRVFPHTYLWFDESSASTARIEMVHVDVWRMRANISSHFLTFLNHNFNIFAAATSRFSRNRLVQRCCECADAWRVRINFTADRIESIFNVERENYHRKFRFSDFPFIRTWDEKNQSWRSFSLERADGDLCPEEEENWKFL